MAKGLLRIYLWDRVTDEIREVDDILDWAVGMEGDGTQEGRLRARRVARDEFHVGDDAFVVFTSFLGTDMNFFGAEGSHPLVFETMYTKNGEWADYQLRYSTGKDALNGHRGVAEVLKSGRELGE